MPDVFSYVKERKIPKTVKDCCKADILVNNMRDWSKNLESWGAGLFAALIIIGIISTIVESVKIADVDAEIVFVAIVLSAIKWVLWAIVEYCVYHSLALLLATFASIVQSTRFSSDIELYKLAKEEGVSKENIQHLHMPGASQPIYEKINSQTWKCKHCGTVNPLSVLDCKACGKIDS